MIRAIFLTTTEPHKIIKAFDAERREILKKLYNCSDTIYTPEMLQDNIAILKDVEYIFSTWGMPSLTKEQIKCLPKLKAVFYAAGTVKNFAQPLFDNGIRLFSSWGANAVPVAEFTFAQIILANKGYFRMSLKQFNQKYEIVKDYKGNYNSVIGLLGMGMIGKAVAQRCKSMKYTVLAYDPYLSEEDAVEYGVKKASLEEIFEKCDVISNHLPNLEELYDILNKDLFSRMKPFATFINTGRGRQVVEADLIECLRKEKGRTALLDVTYPEPPLSDSELFKCDNIFLTPHIAGSINDEILRMADYMIEESISFDTNKKLRYEVTEAMLKTMA